MTREEIIQHCRYYKGEEKNPFDKGPYNDENQDRATLWFYEYIWVDSYLRHVEGDDLLNSYVEDYEYAGLADFEAGDGVPITLKALLFNRYMKWCGGESFDCAPAFKDFYIRYYKLNKGSRRYKETADNSER